MSNPITIQMSESDFDGLTTNSTNWSPYADSWIAQDGRFEPLPDYRKFLRAYWFENYSDLILARSYLFANGFDSTTHYDGAEDEDCHVLLTDFGGILE